MAEDQADAMISAKNEDIEHKVEEVIREKTLYVLQLFSSALINFVSECCTVWNADQGALSGSRYNKAKQEDETVKGVPGVTQVRVVTVTRDATMCSVAGEITEGKKRLAAFVGPPGKHVTEKVFAECHRRLKESGMVPYWIKEMPMHASEVNFDMEMSKLGADTMTVKEKEEGHYAIQAAEAAYGKLALSDHPKRKTVYDACATLTPSTLWPTYFASLNCADTQALYVHSTGYWPGSMGPVQIYVTDANGENQSFMANDFRVFHPSAEPGEGSTVAEVKAMLCAAPFVSPTGLKIRDRICTNRPDDVELVYLGKGESDYGNLVECQHDMTATVTEAGADPVEVEHVTFSLFEMFVGFARPSTEKADVQRIHTALKLADCRVGPSRDDSPDELDGLGGEFPFWVTDDSKKIIFAAEDERTQFSWIDKIDKAIVQAQNVRRETATVRDAKRGNVLQDIKTLLDYKIQQGDCFALRRKPGMAASRHEPAPEPEMGYGVSSETSGLMHKYTGGGRATPAFDESSDAQKKEEELDSEAHEGDADFRRKVVVTNDMANLQRAASQFVSKTREEIIDMVRETLEGHQRAIMAELTVDEIYKDRLMFQRKVRETADVDLAKMGLRVISYTLKDVSDANGYMASLGVRRIEEVKKEARMGEAQEASEADQRCHLYSAQVTQKQKECEIEVASSLKNFTMRQQEWKNEVIEAQQEAAMQTALEIEVQNKKIAELKGAVDATRVKWQTELEKLEKERKELQLKADENLRAEILREESNIIAEAKTKAAILVRTDRS
eukprot:COSAG03_NODE_417_length_8084_cov_21.636694_4_plen_785_part_00